MGNNKFNSKGKGKFEKKEYTPVISEFAKELAATLQDQIEEYLDAQQDIDVMDVRERKSVEHALFDFMSYPTYMENPDGDEDWSNHKIYLLERHLRTDRDTHKLLRANCVVVVLTAGTPAYYATAFVSKDNKWSIIVTPMDQNGPRYRDTYRLQSNQVAAAETAPAEE